MRKSKLFTGNLAETPDSSGDCAKIQQEPRWKMVVFSGAHAEASRAPAEEDGCEAPKVFSVISCRNPKQGHILTEITTGIETTFKIKKQN